MYHKGNKNDSNFFNNFGFAFAPKTKHITKNRYNVCSMEK